MGIGFLTEVFFHLTDKRHKSQWKMKLEKFRLEIIFWLRVILAVKVLFQSYGPDTGAERLTSPFRCYPRAQNRWSDLDWKPITAEWTQFNKNYHSSRVALWHSSVLHRKLGGKALSLLGSNNVYSNIACSCVFLLFLEYHYCCAAP